MLEVIYFIVGLFLLFVGRIDLGPYVARGGRVRLAGLTLAGIAAVNLYMPILYILPNDLQNAQKFFLIIGFVVAFILIIRAFMIGLETKISPDMLTIPAATDYFLVSQQTIEQLIHEGKVQTSRIGRRRYVSKNTLSHYLNKSDEPANNLLPELPRQG